jgi:GT2 family glycosyltransferase
LQQFRKKVFKIKNRVKESDVPMEIHLGYGALYVLTKNFMSKIDELDYPCFLMGEEYFLAWQIKQTGGIIYYDPSLVVFHHEHASVNTMPAKLLYKYSKESFLKFRKFWSKF